MPFDKNFIKISLKNIFDSLNKFLLIILIILIIITLFIRNFVLDLLKFLLLIIIIFRITSKNKYQRNKENIQFLKIKNFFLKPFSNIIRNFKDRDNYVYKKCHNCKTTLKLPLPNQRGINHAKCPNCKKRVTLFTLRKVKIEVIKKEQKNEK